MSNLHKTGEYTSVLMVRRRKDNPGKKNKSVLLFTDRCIEGALEEFEKFALDSSQCEPGEIWRLYVGVTSVRTELVTAKLAVLTTNNTSKKRGVDSLVCSAIEHARDVYYTLIDFDSDSPALFEEFNQLLSEHVADYEQWATPHGHGFLLLGYTQGDPVFDMVHQWSLSHDDCVSIEYNNGFRFAEWRKI